MIYTAPPAAATQRAGFVTDTLVDFLSATVKA